MNPIVNDTKKESKVKRALKNPGLAIKYLCHRYHKTRSWILQNIALLCPFPWLRIALQRARGVKIAKDVYVGTGVFFDDSQPERITIKDGVRIGAWTKIITHDVSFKIAFKGELKLPGGFGAPVVVEKNVMIGTGAMILPGVTIGERSIIGAGAVVTHDIPPRSVAVGIPANVVGTIENLLPNWLSAPKREFGEWKTEPRLLTKEEIARILEMLPKGS